MSLLVVFLHLFPSTLLFLPFPFASFSSCSSSFSFSLNLGWKGHCWIFFWVCWGGKWNGNVSHLSFCPSLPLSLLKRPPNQAQGFPRPLYNYYTNHPIVQLFSYVSLDLGLCLFVTHVGDPSSRSLPSLPPPSLFFSLDPVLFLASSVSDVFTHSCFQEFWSQLWSWSWTQKSWVTSDNVLQNQWVPAWQVYDMLSYAWTPGWGRKFFFQVPASECLTGLWVCWSWTTVKWYSAHVEWSYKLWNLHICTFCIVVE